MTPIVLNVLWGERLERHVEAIPHGTSCAQVHRYAREGLVIVRRFAHSDRILATAQVEACLGGLKLEYSDEANRVYGSR
jgi:hypothetical protein